MSTTRLTGSKVKVCYFMKYLLPENGYDWEERNQSVTAIYFLVPDYIASRFIDHAPFITCTSLATQ